MYERKAERKLLVRDKGTGMGEEALRKRNEEKRMTGEVED
jgi:hypothetical protein